MLLNDAQLEDYAEDNISPMTHVKIGPSSIDLSLSGSYSQIVPAKNVIILGEPVGYIKFDSGIYCLQPNEFILASTNEYLNIPDDKAGYVEGRSSIGRIGLQVQNASFIDAGFEGQITLELNNQSKYPILLKPGVRICQLVLFEMTGPAQQPYCGKYQGQRGATASKLEKDNN